jgi:diguanylate cyclase (GGDEF)-like protein
MPDPEPFPDRPPQEPPLLDAAYRAGIVEILRRMDLGWPDLTRTQAERLTALAAEAAGLEAAAAAHSHGVLAEAAAALQAVLRGHLARNRALDDAEQLEVVDAMVRLHAEVRRDEPGAFLAPMPRILVLTTDALPDALAEEAMAAGYILELHAEAATLLDAVRLEPPDLVVLDLEQSVGDEGLPAFVARLREGRGERPPLAFLSQYADLQARLEAVRAAGAAFFTKPLDLAALLDAVDRLTQLQRQEPLRVLVLEDDPLTAAFCTRILEGAGMRAVVVRDPMAVMQPLVDHRPDALLMDLHMPGCSGAELAAVIRQQEAFVGLPIIFLSGEQQLERQLAALSLGAEDFLTKPIQPWHLISIVTTRALRGRQFRSLLVRDSLTGLLNQASLKEKLRLELARAARTGLPVSFAMLDLDHFKRVNDTHGHMSGDRVLKNLARMLQHRVRKTDILGRWGGEEFSVILPGTGLAEAQRLLEELRERFAQMPQELGRGVGRITLSGGVAEHPRFADAQALVEAADQALYAAKHAGRNRVFAAE